MENKIKLLISEAVQTISNDMSIEVQLSVPQLLFGDFTTNVALILAKKLKQNPIALAEKIKVNMQLDDSIESVEVLKPGFINVWLSKKIL